MCNIRTTVFLLITFAFVVPFGAAQAATKPPAKLHGGGNASKFKNAAMKPKSFVPHKNAKMVNPKGNIPKLNPYQGDIGDGTGVFKAERAKPGSQKPFSGDVGEGTGIFKAERAKPGSQKPFNGDVGEGTGI